MSNQFGSWSLSSPMVNETLRQEMRGSYGITGIDINNGSNTHYGQIVVFDNPTHARLIAAAPELVKSLEFISDKAHKGANGGLRVPGKADSVRDLKNLLRTLKQQADAALALVDSKNGEL